MSADSVYCQPSVPSLPAPFAVDPNRADYTGLDYGLYIPGTSSGRDIPGALSALFAASELDFSIDFAGTYTGALPLLKTAFSKSYSGALKKGVFRDISHSIDGLSDTDTEYGTAITSLHREWRPDDTSSMWKTGSSGTPLAWQEIESEDAEDPDLPDSYYQYVFQLFMHPVPVATDPFNDPPTLNFYPALEVWHPQCSLYWEVRYFEDLLDVGTVLIGAGGNSLGFPGTGTSMTGLTYFGIDWVLQEKDLDSISGTIDLGAWHTDF